VRKCIDCQEEKDIIEFAKNGRWYRHRCKKCHNLKFQPATGKPNAGKFKKGQNLGNTNGFLKGKKPISPFPKGNKPWNYGSDGRQGYKYKAWRKAVLSRDKFCCTRCGSKDKLHCHHKISWRENIELRFDVGNGETLCASCHAIEGHKNRELSKATQFKKGNAPWNKKKVTYARL